MPDKVPYGRKDVSRRQTTCNVVAAEALIHLKALSVGGLSQQTHIETRQLAFGSSKASHWLHVPPRERALLLGKKLKWGETFKKEMVMVTSVRFQEVSGTTQCPLSLAARTHLVKLAGAVTMGLAHGGDGSPGRSSSVH